MVKTIVVLAAIISIISAFSFVDLAGFLSNLKLENARLPIKPYGAADCTTQLAAECALDIERTVKACAAAFESEGANIIADIKCAKDLLSDKKTCWPCICYEAEKKGWKIIGC